MDAQISNETPVVLVVDDTPENRAILRIMLQKEGYRVELAEDGVDALEKMEACTPDLVLLDVMMPGHDGFEVCQKIRTAKSWDHVPVIFMTALGQTSDKVKGFEVGGVDYIVKPFVVQEVLARVRVHLQLKQAMERLQSQAITDELTGAYNRRFAFEVLGKALMREERRPDRVLLAYLDIDDLKKVNDQHGHQKGDALICAVVDGLRSVLRSSDYLCRMGGDEFLLIMFDCAEEDCELLLNRVNQRLSDPENPELVPRFSFGISSHRSGDAPTTAEALIGEADDRMYRMKTGQKTLAK